jgi:hypothetical protein
MPAWEENGSRDSYLAFAWEDDKGSRGLVSVNYAPHDSQCYVRLPFNDMAGKSILFRDLAGPAVYERNGCELQSKGLYLDLPAWGYHAFEILINNSS